MDANQWILGGDTGISSKVIWAVMMGATPAEVDVPYDPSDFGRCHRLLQLFPEWRGRLDEVARAYPAWGPLVREWGQLEALYEEEWPTGRAPRLYTRMQALREESMKLDGWVQHAPGCWTKQTKGRAR